MAFHVVLVHGDGIRMAGEAGEPPAIGFYTNRVVWAPDEAAAERKAVASVRELWSAGRYAEANLGDPPALTAESVSDSSLGAYLRQSWLHALDRRGHTFYSVTEDKDEAQPNVPGSN